MFSMIPSVQPIPPKVWMRATDVLAAYVHSGHKFISAGKPKTGEISDELSVIEKEYNQMADAIWFAKWTEDQREEWSRICSYYER